MKFHKGRYVLKNPDKYVGNKDNIVYRSSWEKVMMINLDNNPNVWKWTSEETVIPYISPLDNRRHKYYMDFTVFYKDKEGEVYTTLIEVKPYAQTIEPVLTKGKKKKTFDREMKTYLVNQAKWKHARTLAESKKNCKFVIMTEKDIFK